MKKMTCSLSSKFHRLVNRTWMAAVSYTHLTLPTN